MGGCTFVLEVALTGAAQARGLMGRDSLPHDHGMLFIFDRERILGFWMQGTLIPLDIAFLDDDDVVVDVQTMRPARETPAGEPLPIHTSAAPASSAIEVNAGVAAECGIVPGVQADIAPFAIEAG